MKEFTIGANEAGQRFDKYLRKRLPEAPGSFLYKMLRKKNITLNGAKASGEEKLAVNDAVRIFFSDETFLKFAGEGKGFARASHTLDILYEDSHIAVINKPVGMLSQKGEEDVPSLVEYFITYLLESGQLSETELATFRPSICNRLDRNTSGIVTAGKSLAGLQQLSALFHDRALHKYYYTIVDGILKKERNIKGYLHKDKKCNKVIVDAHPMEDSSPIQTRYLPLGNNGKITFLKVELLTGRTHQIRAHLSSIGHPIIGDGKYGNAEANLYYRQVYGLKYQLLHAGELEIPEHCPELSYLSGRRFAAPLPVMFERILRGEHLRDERMAEETKKGRKKV